jgi:stearoyl-CoA desaturase (delta-9 desaturase)
MTYYGLKLLERLGLIWDVRDVPEYVRDGKSKQESDLNVLKRPIEMKIPVPAQAEEIPA